MIEAMFYRKPIIGPKISAIPEVIENMQNGILVEHNSVKYYTDAMIRLSNKKLRNKLSLKSKLLLSKKFSFNEMIYKTMKLYSN